MSSESRATLEARARVQKIQQQLREAENELSAARAKDQFDALNRSEQVRRIAKQKAASGEYRG